MGVLIGIDLGTTTTVAARFNEAGHAEIVPSWVDGFAFTHSAFWFERENPGQPTTIGKIARGLAGVEEGAFREYKRHMGTEFVFTAHGRTYSPQKLTQMMLERYRQHIINEHAEIDSLAITVPANFRDAARQQTVQAALDAGFPQPIQVIDEPTAAALYYAFTSPNPLEGTYVIYDFGGGTLDVSVVTVSGLEVEVRMTDGVPQLGGMDLDRIVFELVSEKFLQARGVPLTTEDCGFNVEQAEALKEQLSEFPHRSIDLFSVQHGKVRVTVTQAEFVARAMPLFRQSMACVDRTLDQAGFAPEAIDGVFMAGGTSSIPVLREMLAEKFGREPVRRNPSQAIALGAAIYAGYRGLARRPQMLAAAQAEKLDAMEVTQSCPHFLGTTALDEEGDEYNSILIRKGDARPISVTEVYYVDHDGQEDVRCDVTQCDLRTLNLDNVQLRRIFDEYMPIEGAQQGDEIHVTYSYDENGVFEGIFHYPGPDGDGPTIKFKGNL
jgi:molecular chaperone DnaK